MLNNDTVLVVSLRLIVLPDLYYYFILPMFVFFKQMGLSNTGLSKHFCTMPPPVKMKAWASTPLYIKNWVGIWKKEIQYYIENKTVIRYNIISFNLS